MKGKLTVLAVVVIPYVAACGLLPSPEVVEKVVKETVVVEKKVVVTATPISPTRTPLPPTDTPKPVLPTDTPTPVPPTDTPAPVPPPAVTEAGQVWVSPINGAEMVYVPAGEFLMGTPEEDVDALREKYGGLQIRLKAETPQHKVYLDAFYIDRTEVTNTQYRKCVEAGACSQPQITDPWYNDPNRAEHPVVFVDWNQANDYCRWAGKRLPTEAEWEKAARGTDGRVYPWGNEWDRNKLNWDTIYFTTAVGSYPAGASPYGALDMAGNVWEWMADWYGEDYYSQSPGRNPPGPDSGEKRVWRGGAGDNPQGDSRCAYRLPFDPRGAYEYVGFRCAKDAE